MRSVARACGLLARAGIVAGALGLFAAPASGAVDRILLVPAVEGVVVAGIADAEALMTCAAADAGAEGAESVRDTWSDERDLIIATLWATGFPEDKIRAIEAKTDPASLVPAPRTPDQCREIMRRHPLPDDRKPHRRLWRFLAMAGIDPGAVKPVKPRTLAMVEAAFEEAFPNLARALKCLSFTNPKGFELTASTWRDQIAEVRRSLRAVGWPRDVVDRFVLPADVDRLVKRADVATVDVTACEADDAWMRWLYDLGFLRVGIVVREVLAEE